jgi:hypothetical protein
MQLEEIIEFIGMRCRVDAGSAGAFEGSLMMDDVSMYVDPGDGSDPKKLDPAAVTKVTPLD